MSCRICDSLKSVKDRIPSDLYKILGEIYEICDDPISPLDKSEPENYSPEKWSKFESTVWKKFPSMNLNTGSRKTDSRLVSDSLRVFKEYPHRWGELEFAQVNGICVDEYYFGVIND